MACYNRETGPGTQVTPYQCSHYLGLQATGHEMRRSRISAYQFPEQCYIPSYPTLFPRLFLIFPIHDAPTLILPAPQPWPWSMLGHPSSSLLQVLPLELGTAWLVAWPPKLCSAGPGLVLSTWQPALSSIPQSRWAPWPHHCLSSQEDQLLLQHRGAKGRAQGQMVQSDPISTLGSVWTKRNSIFWRKLNNLPECTIMLSHLRWNGRGSFLCLCVCVCVYVCLKAHFDMIGFMGNMLETTGTLFRNLYLLYVATLNSCLILPRNIRNNYSDFQ